MALRSGHVQEMKEWKICFQPPQEASEAVLGALGALGSVGFAADPHHLGGLRCQNPSKDNFQCVILVLAKRRR